MEDLFGVIMVVIALVAAVAQKSKKQAKQQRRPSPVAYPEAEPVPASAPMANPAAEPAPAPATVAYPAAEPAASRRPAMAPRLQVTPRTEDLFAGSMHAETHEGEDPCHEAQLRSAPPLLAPMPEEKPGLQLSFSSDSMVQAFVMQEILQRPCQRRR